VRCSAHLKTLKVPHRNALCPGVVERCGLRQRYQKLRTAKKLTNSTEAFAILSQTRQELAGVELAPKPFREVDDVTSSL